MTAATIPTNMAIVLLASLLVSSSGNAGFASEVVSLRQIAAQEVADGGLPPAPAPQPASAPSYADQAHDLLGFSRRVTSVDFDAHLANWDRDVEFDGIALRLFPLDAAASRCGTSTRLFHPQALND